MVKHLHQQRCALPQGRDCSRHGQNCTQFSRIVGVHETAGKGDSRISRTGL